MLRLWRRLTASRAPYDADGHTLDVWERAMWDNGENPGRFASATTEHSTAPCVFCRTCLTNQTLVTNLLANYLGEHDDDDTDTARLEALPAYKHSLEQRYPMACEACAQKASARIQAVDRQVRQQLLGAWVQPPSARHDQGEFVEADIYHAQISRWKWRRRHWYVVQAATLVLGAYSLRTHHSRWTWTLGALAVMPTVYDPSWHDAATIRMRGAQPIESGATCWKCAQALAWLARCALVLLVGMYEVHADIIVALLVAHTACLVYARSQRCVSAPEPLHLISRTVSPPAPAARTGTDPLAGMSLGAAQAAPPLDTLLEPAPMVEEAMELEEEVPRAVHLAPPRLPPASSGLEELFAKSLALDAPPTQAHPWHWTTSRAPVVAAVVLCGIGIGLALARS
ncbi:hypothetical protein MBRA1_000543 [Malassezia brasiliensis]|uniref:Ima1 N-terminal domain-containing protein n=1 Tax=Malassezia brasiliensis TaxID=1821822 RepID=A0AAF0IMF3_9BASI|nr:hypothetical protein MBRA1_000543 [Malassezia brasiliensis]